MKTIAIDFDGVIHKYSKGWMNGSIYDEPIEGAFETIQQMMFNGYSVFIFTSRDVNQVKGWIDNLTYTLEVRGDDPSDMYRVPIYKYGFSTQIIPAWKWWIKFWNKEQVLGITNRKLPAMIYIDDRALKFENWDDVKTKLELK
jgi:hypothetical protein